MESPSSRESIYQSLQHVLYDYTQDNQLEWPCSTCKWGQLESQHSDYFKQEVLFGMRTDQCEKLPSFVVVASVKIPRVGFTFDPALEALYHTNRR